MKTFVVTVLGLLIAASPAAAETFSNSPQGGYQRLGSSGTIAYGQVFVTPSANLLQSVNFYGGSGAQGNVGLVIANWNGTQTTGSELYRGVTSYSGTTTFPTTTPISFSDINLALTAGRSYIAYMTSYNVTSPIAGITVAASGSSPLRGNFYFNIGNGPDPLTSGSWINSGSQLQYSFTFANGAVPEPATWAMMLVGFGGIGFAMRRRKKVTTTVAYA